MALRDFAESYSAAVEAKTVPADAPEYFAPFVAESFELVLTIAQRSSSSDAFVVRGQAAAASAIIASSLSSEVLPRQKVPTLTPLLTASMEAEPDIGEGELSRRDLCRPSKHACHLECIGRKSSVRRSNRSLMHRFRVICRALADGAPMVRPMRRSRKRMRMVCHNNRTTSHVTESDLCP